MRGHGPSKSYCPELEIFELLVLELFISLEFNLSCD